MDIWQEEFDAIESNATGSASFVLRWNQNVIPWMEYRGNEYKRVAHAYALKKGLEFDKAKHAYILPWPMKAVRGKNLVDVGWKDGVLRVGFNSKTGPRYYHSIGDKVDREVAVKLCRSPYPDNLYSQIVSKKIAMERE